MPGRKRALTGREAAKREKADRSRARRKAELEARVRDNADDLIEQLEQERSQYYNDIAEEYHALREEDIKEANNFDFDDFIDIDSLIPSSPLIPTISGPSTTLTAQMRTLPPSKGLAALQLLKDLKQRHIRSPSLSSEPTLLQLRTPLEISSDDDDNTTSITSPTPS
jgi:hypothetical protein